MELIFIYIKNYRTFQDQAIYLTNKFQVSVDEQGIKIVKNENYQKIFPDHITNVNVILGKNASGKTSLLNLVGDRMCFRPDVEAERYSEDYIMKRSLEGEEKDEYFFIYHLKNNLYKEGIFLLEGNISSFKNLICEGGHPLEFYDSFRNGQWKLIECILQEGRLHYHNHVESKNKLEYKQHHYKSTRGEVILYFENKKAETVLKNYDDRVFFDENCYSLGRRYCKTKEDSIYKQVQLIQHSGSELYQNECYTLVLDFTPYVHKSAERDHCDVSQFCEFIETWEILDQLKFLLLATDLCYLCKYTDHICSGFCKPRVSPVDVIQNNCILLWGKTQWDKSPEESIKMCNETLNYIYNSVVAFYDKVNNNETFYNSFLKRVALIRKTQEVITTLSLECQQADADITFLRMVLKIKFSKKTDLASFEEFFTVIKDNYHDWDDSNFPVPCHEVFPVVEFLSEGEMTFLSYFTAIKEQIEQFTNGKEYYILLLDEIEQSMHPEMCRRFLNDLMKFLKNYPNKTFQIIISSHSPFLISDLPCSSVIRLKKNDGASIALCNKASAPTFGQNIHTILKNDFFLSHTCGEYALSMMKKIATFLDENNHGVEKFLQDEFNITIKEEEGLVFFQSFIGEIGEPLVKNALEIKLENWKKNTISADDRIKELEEELTKLKMQRDSVVDT